MLQQLQSRGCILLLVGVFSCLFHSGRGCQAQMMSPFSGQGLAPGSGTDIGLLYLNSSDMVALTAALHFPKVYVSCFLDRLLKVNEHEYGFEAVIFMRLSWDDPRALGEIYRRTNETYAAGKGEECKRPCHTQYHQCCDSLWLPGLDLVNVWGLPQDRVDFELISLNVKNLTNVHWIRRFNGIFYSPMNFRRFPFDRQVLVIEFWSQACCHELSTSSVSTKLETLNPYSQQRRAADLSSWKVMNVSIEAFKFDLSQVITGVTFSNPEEPWAFKPGPGKASPFPNFESSATGPDSLRIYIVVDRLSWYYIISYEFPMILCVLVSWWTLWISPRSIETRMTVLVSLFLSLTALQFIISSQLPASSYITVMGWIVVASYFLIVLATFETILVYCIFRWYVHGHDKEAPPGEMLREQSLAALTGNDSQRGDSVDVGNHAMSSADSMEAKDEDRMVESVREGTGTLSERRRESLHHRLKKKITNGGHSLVRLLSSNPLRSTFEMTRQFESSLRRDIAKANKVISRIETISMWAFPLLYSLLLGIVFAAI